MNQKNKLQKPSYIIIAKNRNTFVRIISIAYKFQIIIEADMESSNGNLILTKKGNLLA